MPIATLSKYPNAYSILFSDFAVISLIMEAGEETTLNPSGAVNENTYMNSSLIQLVTTTDENMTSV